jgi:hypothetical protein
MTGAAGIGAAAIAHPWMAAGAVLGVYGLASYGGPGNQAMPAGPATNNALPGSTEAKSNYDLGASGDLVFNLHKLNH